MSTSWGYAYLLPNVKPVKKSLTTGEFSPWFLTRLVPMLLCRNCGTFEHLYIIKGVCQQGPEKALSKTNSCHKLPNKKRVTSAVVVPAGGNGDVVSPKASHMLEERHDGTLADEELWGGRIAIGKVWSHCQWESEGTVNWRRSRQEGALSPLRQVPHPSQSKTTCGYAILKINFIIMHRSRHDYNWFQKHAEQISTMGEVSFCCLYRLNTLMTLFIGLMDFVSNAMPMD